VVWLCSRIGAPVNEPQVAAVQVKLKAGAKFADVAEPARQIVRRELRQMPSFCRQLAQGAFSIC
jgi:S-adenosylmethionine synthetase